MEQKKIVQYFEQNSDLRVLFVFDHLGDRIREIESFDWQPPYRVARFSGDWFATKCRIADLPAAEKLILLLPQESPLGIEERMRTFPLLGELCANAAYIDDDYHAFMTLHGLPTGCSAFVCSHLGDLQLAKFDKVLGPHYGADFNAEIGYRGLLSVLLGEGSLREWKELFARIMVLDAESDSKKRVSFFAALFSNRYSDVVDALQERLKQNFGAELDPNKEPHLANAAIRLRYNTVVQNLPVCETDHYKSCRVTDGVVINRMNLFLQYAAELPEAKRNEFFKAFEKLSADIHMRHLTDEYGSDANYGAYPPALCREILTKLAAQDAVKNAVAVRDRARSILSRTEAGVRMRAVAAFLATCAEFYIVLSKVKTFKLNAPNEFVFTYASEWFELDRTYRLAVERFYHILRDEDRLIVEELKKKLDGDYWVKTGDANVAWLDSLRSFGGTNKLAMFTLQGDFHKEIGDDAIKHAVIISDGLRFEVAKEIEERVNSGRHKAVLKPAIAMLPSETKYCKPVLMPHENVEFTHGGGACDVRVDDKCVVSMLDRRTQLMAYWPEGACVDAAKLSQMTQADKRALFKKPLVYVYHDVIDRNGHGPNATGKDVAEACRKTVDELVQLITSIHSTYNVTDVLLVSDHGFLMNDVIFDDKDKIPVPPTENVLEKTTRYYLTQSTADVHGITKFALKDVSEMNDATLVAVPNGTARFAASGGYVYAHGGASLQEVVIPILHSQSLRPDAREKVGISLVDNKLQVTSSQLKVKLLQDDVATATVQSRTVVCGLYANDKLVTAEKTVVFDLTDPDPNERIKVVELVLAENPGTGILQLRIFDEGDRLNPVLQVSVTNCTLIERDF